MPKMDSLQNELKELVHSYDLRLAEYEERIANLEDYIKNRMLDLNDTNGDGQVNNDDEIGF